MTPRRLLPILLLALASTGCVPQGPDLAAWWFEQPVASSATDQPTQQHVVVIGDSLTVGAEQPAKEAWKPTGAAVSYNAFGGTQWQHWSARFANVPQGSTLLVLLGTNDLGNLDLQTAEWNTLAALNIVAAQQPACVVWFRLNTTTAALRKPAIMGRTLAYNAWFDQLVADGTYPWLTIEPWDVTSDGHTEWLQLPADPVHMTPDGYRAYAEAQAGAPARCAQPAA